MPSTFRVIDREIQPKEKCYIICTAYDSADFSESLDVLIRTAVVRGAKKLYFACQDENAAFDETGFDIGAYRFVFDTNFLILKKELSGIIPLNRPLRTKPLRESTAELYRDLTNDIFFSVPNSQTLLESDTEDMLANEKRSSGFLMDGGMPVGIFEFDLSEDVPEIASIGIRSDLQGNGYGKSALKLLENTLYKSGFRSVKLLAAASNHTAMSLYLSNGYSTDRVLSRWYRTESVK